MKMVSNYISRCTEYLIVYAVFPSQVLSCSFMCVEGTLSRMVQHCYVFLKSAGVIS